ncbi:MAG: TVP38/TMEM64 family protein [Oligoflexia bacterium]|nr:TVP38/TMEM64 family protein [Oligoflexia bacterium]
MLKKYKLIILALGFLSITIILVKLDYFSHLNFEYINSQRQNLITFSTTHPVLTRIYFFSAYVTLATLSIPGALFLTLISPSLFNFIESFVLVALASSLGASFSFLIFRFFLKDFAQKLFKKQIQKYKTQITQNQKPFLLSLRLIPIFPFSWVSIIYSVSDMKLKPFFWLTLIGMIPGICVNLYVGLQLSSIKSINDIYSFKMISAFFLMATFPLILKPFIKRFLP